MMRAEVRRSLRASALAEQETVYNRLLAVIDERFAIRKLTDQSEILTRMKVWGPDCAALIEQAKHCGLTSGVSRNAIAYYLTCFRPD